MVYYFILKFAISYLILSYYYIKLNLNIIILLLGCYNSPPLKEFSSSKTYLNRITLDKTLSSDSRVPKSHCHLLVLPKLPSPMQFLYPAIASTLDPLSAQVMFQQSGYLSPAHHLLRLHATDQQCTSSTEIHETHYANLQVTEVTQYDRLLPLSSPKSDKDQ